jgi:hypothetical protein
MRLTSIDLESDNDSRQKVSVELVNNSESFSLRTSSDPLDSEKNVSAQRLFVPSNTVTSTMIERIRGTQGSVTNEYVEAYTDDVDSDIESVSDMNVERNLAFEVYVICDALYFYYFLLTYKNQAVLPLIISVAGLMSAGWLLDAVQVSDFEIILAQLT